MAVVACGSSITSNFGLVRTGKLDIIDSSETARISLSSAGGGQIVFRDGEAQVLDAATLRRLLASAQPPAPAP